MKRKTFDFGIDLGTTNSSIAIVEGTETLVIKNNAGDETTPSAVFMDSKNTLAVGEKAKEKVVKDPENAFSEFKRQMGTHYTYRFEGSGKEMSPEELSAEVLKSLKQNVQQRMKNEEVTHAVITVPAAFELPQNEATSKSATLAGFSQCILLQEPVAAALAYGFQEETDNVFWLVYDLGGGTFDAALIQIKEGAIRVVDHEGDNHLGGKDIDWEILNQLVIPKLHEDYQLKDFTRSNPEWNKAFARLKAETEKAKIRLSRDEVAEVDIEYLGSDEEGTPMMLNHDIYRNDLERLVSPFISRTINICKDLLNRNNLKSSDIEKIVLVGGPTLMPHLRKMLVDKKTGLSMEIDFSVDPLTAVARGAAIFAGTSRIESGLIKDDELKPGILALQLEYKPVGSEEEPLIGGSIISSDITDFEKYTIQFINQSSQPGWDSGKIEISADGTFITNLWAQKGLKNIYKIAVFNREGAIISAEPDEIEYTIGLAFSNPPLTHSLGIAQADNKVDVVFEKGTSLPVKRRVKHSTIQYLSSGSEDQVKIPIVEGQNVRADRNPDIGNIVINGKDVARDLPAGTEIEILVEVDQSGLLKASAYIPILDQEFDGIAKLRSPEPEPEMVRNDFEREKKRLDKLVDQLEEFDNKKAANELKKLEEEQMIEEVEDALNAIEGDKDAAQKCDDRIRKIKASLDKIEDAVEWPVLMEKANGLMESIRVLVKDQGSQDERKIFRSLLAEVKSAIDSRDSISLSHSVDRLEEFGSILYWKQPAAWIDYFDRAQARKAEIQDQQLAERLCNQGREAIESNNIEELRAVCLQLAELLPGDEELLMAGYGGGTIKL